MKRNFKFKALVLAMVVMMGLALVPSLNAATIADVRYTNKSGVTEDNADVVMSFNADKKVLVPGEEVKVTVSIDKTPVDGLNAVSMKLAYDASKLEVSYEEKVVAGFNERTYTCIKPGPIATALDFKQEKVGDIEVAGLDSFRTTTIGVAANASAATKLTGTVFEVTFKVKENASGNVEMFPLTNKEPFAGLDFGTPGAVEGKLGTVRPANWLIKTEGIEGMKIPVAATGIAFEGITSVELDKSGTRSMDLSEYAKPNPSNTTDDITWEVADETIATVTNGVVTAVANGSTTVTVRCGAYSASVPVNVTTTPSSLSFNNNNYVVNYEETRNLKNEVTVGPEGAVYEASAMTWSSSNTSVATVDANGVVTALAKGKTNITVTLGKISKTVEVTVAVPLRSIKIDPTTLEVWKGEEGKVVVTAQPEGAVWESLVPEFISGAEFAEAKEAADGIVVTGKAEGDAQIAISVNKNTSGDDLYKLVSVKVKENRVTSAVINNEEGAEVLRGKTLTMDGSYTTEYDEEKVHKSTDDTTKVWESLNPEVATVDANGVVTAVKEGTATIKLTVAGKTATYDVKVKEIHVDGIEFSEETQKTLEEIEELTVGDVVKIEFTVTPEDNTDTVEEILDFVKVAFDEDLVDVTVEYDKETGKGVITVTVKKAGEAEVIIVAGDPEDEDAEAYVFSFTAVDPVVEEAPETGDMPVAMMLVLMAVSAMGIVASKKVFVK